MKKYLKTGIILCAVALLVLNASAQTKQTRVWAERTVNPPVIFSEGSPSNTEATVTLKAWASGDSQYVGNPLDIIFVTDNSPKMQSREIGAPPNTTDPNRMEGAYVASINFVDSFLTAASSRAALFRFAEPVDNPFGYNGDMNYVKGQLDSSLLGDATDQGNSLWRCIHAALLYAAENYRANATTAILALTSGNDRNSWKQGMGPDMLGNTEAEAVDSVIYILDSLKNAGIDIEIFIVGVGSGVHDNDLMMTTVASATDTGFYVHTPDGLGINTTFQLIGGILVDIVAVQISPTIPMITDVLGPDIHYVPGSYVSTGALTPDFSVDTVGGLTRLMFQLDTIKLGQFMEVSYRITAAVSDLDTSHAVLMRTNNGSTHDPVNFSKIMYKDLNDSSYTFPLPVNYVLVKSGINAIYLSLSPDSLVYPSPSKIVSLPYTSGTPGTYPSTTLYALLELGVPGSYEYQPILVTWNLNPPSGWTAPLLVDAQDSSQNIQITVPYPNAGQCTLTVKYLVQDVVYEDYLIFSAYETGGVDSIISIVIDDNPATPEFIDPPRFTITGNKTQLNGFSQVLYSMAITNQNNYFSINATWAVSDFAIFNTQLSSIFTGTGNQKTLDLNVPDASYSQTDSGYITITDTGGHSFKLQVVIYDTSQYDTINNIVIYDNNYGNDVNQIEANYPSQVSKSSYTLTLNDSVTFYPMFFYISGTDGKYLGTGPATWVLNNQAPITSSSFTLSGGTPLQTDQLIVIYTNEWGQEVRDTVTVMWGFGNERYLHLEARPGEVGKTTASPIQNIIVPNNADTIRGIYAVIRDENGVCVYDGTTNNEHEYAIWSVSNAAVLTFVDIPTDTISIGWVYRKQSPGTETSFHLIATGTHFQEITGQKDSVLVTLVNYSFNGINIFADVSPTTIVDTTGHIYAADDEITGVLSLVALDDTVKLKAKLRRNTDNAWIAQAVDWTLTDFSIVRENAFNAGINVTLAPTDTITINALIASFTFGGGTTLYDTVYFTVGESWISTIIVVYGDTNVTAGDPFNFTILVIDKNGDTVTLEDRLPTDFSITTDNGILLNDTIWLDDTTFIVMDRFLNGVSNNTITPIHSGPNTISLKITYPGPNGPVTVIETFTLDVEPGAPDSIAVVRISDNAPAVEDTLVPGGSDLADSVIYYRVELYDEYGNLIPATSSVYADYFMSLQGSILDPAKISKDNNTIGYHATGTQGGGKGTITVNYPRGADTLQYHFNIVIVPLIGIVSISTHEWIADTSGGNIDVNSVLQNVLNINTFVLTNQNKLDSLARYGYKPYRDGFLDYLDITLSQPFYLKEEYVSQIRFQTVIDNDPYSVTWLVTDGSRTIKVVPVGQAQADGYTQYRLWLIPNSLQQDTAAPLETGLLPSVTFDNGAISSDTANQSSFLLGTGTALYTISATVDSAPPVISDFLLQSNACSKEEQNDAIEIYFSEPVKSSSIPGYSAIDGFALVRGTTTNNTFMRNAIKSGEKMQKVLNIVQAWNVEDPSAIAMSYRAVVKEESTSVFKAGVTKIKFTVDRTIKEFVDLAGNNGCVSDNKPVPLRFDAQTEEEICSVNGITVVSRHSAISFSWSTDPVDGSPVPNFHFFGITVNLQSVIEQIPSSNMVYTHFLSVTGDSFVVADLDTSHAFIETHVFIYDLFGILVASPQSHDALKAGFTLAEIKRTMGLDEIQDNLKNMTMDDILQYYSLTEADDPSHPDTLRPIYPPTFTIGYEYLVDNCGPESGNEMCLPAWNCLNSKGRLVAPGGYVALQNLRTGSAESEVFRKIIVTDTVVEF